LHGARHFASFKQKQSIGFERRVIKRKQTFPTPHYCVLLCTFLVAHRYRNNRLSYS
jgi:hypothetical protein